MREKPTHNGTMEAWPLIRVQSDATLAEVAHTICQRSVGALGVNDSQGNFLGIVTERDLAWVIAQGHHPAALTAEDVVNDFPIVVEGPITAPAAANKMLSAHVRHLVVRADGNYGIVSIRDVLRGASFDSPSSEGTRTVNAGDIMTSPCVACREDSRVDEIAELLAARRISGMPVVDSDGNVTGVISERDVAYSLGGPLVRLAMRPPAAVGGGGPRVARNPGRLTMVRDVMSRPPIIVSRDVLAQRVAEIMVEERINRIPVIEGGRLVGIVTRTDVVNAFAGSTGRPAERSVITVGGRGDITMR